MGEAGVGETVEEVGGTVSLLVASSNGCNQHFCSKG